MVCRRRNRHFDSGAEVLDAGADDYFGKPFGVPELLARVRAQGASFRDIREHHR